jgi:hypothetical protein
MSKSISVTSPEAKQTKLLNYYLLSQVHGFMIALGTGVLEVVET